MVSVAVALGSVAPAWAQTELQWWHAMRGQQRCDRSARRGVQQHAEGLKVVPVYKGSYPDTMNAGIAAFRAGNPPHILQVFEAGTATMMATKGAVKPVYQLMQEAGDRGPATFRPAGQHRADQVRA
jgi:sn-glycerol 3-phosphate transport system substrate-binding protein